MSEFEVTKSVMEGRFKTCPVCDKDFRKGEKIVLASIQEPRKGFATVMAIPVHTLCYWVDD